MRISSSFVAFFWLVVVAVSMVVATGGLVFAKDKNSNAPIEMASLNDGLRVPTVMRLTSLDWPPYTGQDLPEQGQTTERLRAILHKMGMGLEVEFLPWKRAMRQGTKDKEFHGYFPEYQSDALTCLISPAFDSSQVGFVVRSKGRKVEWRYIEDLARYRIGVVDGYVNDAGPFDAAVARGVIQVDVTTDDLRNLKKVAARRIDTAIVDRRVMDYLIQRELPHLKGRLTMSNRLLRVHGLHVCFKPDPIGKFLLTMMEEAMADKQVSLHN